jgi:hypothetical protein
MLSAVIYTSVNNNNFDWGPVPHFCPLEALQPVWLTPEVYCTITSVKRCKEIHDVQSVQS